LWEEKEHRFKFAEVREMHFCPLLQRDLPEGELEGAQAYVPGDRSEAGRRFRSTETSVRIGVGAYQG